MIERSRFVNEIVARLAGLIAIPPVVVASISALLLLTATSIFPTAPLIYPAVIFCAWLAANHFFEIVRHRAAGYAGWPVPSIETISAARRQSGIVFGAFVTIAVAAVVLLAQTEWWPAGQIFAFVALGLMPASAAILAATGSTLQGLNPFTLITVAGRIGLRYLYVLLGLGAFLLLARWAAARGGFVAYFAAVYSYMLVAYLLGGVIYARRGALGIEPARSPEARAQKAERERVAQRRAALTHAYGFAARGNIAGAIEHIEQSAAGDVDPIAARIWMFDQMCEWEDARPALQFGNSLRAELEQAGQIASANKVLAACEHLRAESMADDWS